MIFRNSSIPVLSAIKLPCQCVFMKIVYGLLMSIILAWDGFCMPLSSSLLRSLTTPLQHTGRACKLHGKQATHLPVQALITASLAKLDSLSLQLHVCSIQQHHPRVKSSNNTPKSRMNAGSVESETFSSFLVVANSPASRETNAGPNLRLAMVNCTPTDLYPHFSSRSTNVDYFVSQA